MAQPHTRSLLPKWLQFGKHLFANVTRVAPTVRKLEQHTVEAFPVVIQRSAVGLGPGLEFINQGQTLCAVDGGLGLGFFPARLSTTLCASLQASSKRFQSAWLGAPPWSVSFHCSPQLAQMVLNFSPTHGLAFRALGQAFSLGH